MENKAANVKGFFLYFDQFEAIKNLSESQKAMLLDAMFVKFAGGDYEITDPTVKMAFSFISLSHEQRMQKYAERSEKARESVNKRWEKERNKSIQNNTEDTNEYERINRNTNDTITITRTITKTKEDNKNISCSLSEKVSDGNEEGGDVVQGSLLPEADCIKPKKPEVPYCPQEKIIELYHERLPELPQIRSWIGANSTNLRTRWRERWAAGKYKTTEEGLAYWRSVFAWVHDNCPHLMGQNDRGWKMNLAWFVKAANFSKFLNRTYDRQAREGA